jgi:hypothetical protein
MLKFYNEHYFYLSKDACFSKLLRIEHRLIWCKLQNKENACETKTDTVLSLLIKHRSTEIVIWKSPNNTIIQKCYFQVL